ncbi:MAG: LAGLIDADG family homing endonuclease [Candidatus Micrarchaeota archaeon]
MVDKNPVIELGSYIQDLKITKEKGNDEVRAYSIKNYLKTKFGKNTYKEIAKMSNNKYKNIINWLGDAKRDVGIPISELLKLAEILQITELELYKKITYLGGTNTKKYILPKQIDSSLAYLLGYIMGDGHLANPNDTIGNGSKYNAEIRITTIDKHHLEYLQEIFIKLFAYKPPLFKEHNFYRLIGRSKVIHLFLTKICQIPTGNKKEKTNVPKILNNLELQKYFLAGFFDADGSVSIVKNKVRRISIKQHNKRILEECLEILIKMGIERPHIYKDNGIRNGKITTASILVIQNQADILKFIDNFNSLKLIDRGLKKHG